MEARALETTFKVAGVGGASITLVFLIFNSVIIKLLKDNVPLLKPEQSSEIIKLILLLVFTIAIIGLIGWLIKPPPVLSVVLVIIMFLLMMPLLLISVNPPVLKQIAEIIDKWLPPIPPPRIDGYGKIVSFRPHGDTLTVTWINGITKNLFIKDYYWNIGSILSGDVNGDERSDIIHVVWNRNNPSGFYNYVHVHVSLGGGDFDSKTFFDFKDYDASSGDWTVKDCSNDKYDDLVHQLPSGHMDYWISQQVTGRFRITNVCSR